MLRAHREPGWHPGDDGAGETATLLPLRKSLLDFRSRTPNLFLREPWPLPAPMGRVVAARQRFPSLLTPWPKHCLVCVPGRTSCHLQISWCSRHPLRDSAGWDRARLDPPGRFNGCLWGLTGVQRATWEEESPRRRSTDSGSIRTDLTREKALGSANPRPSHLMRTS